MDNVTVFKAQKWAFSFIAEHQKETSAAELLLQGQMNWSTTEMLVHYQDVLSQEQWALFKANVIKYCQGWPAQYLLGKANFFGLELKVTEDTLIPRQETEELVEWILADHKNPELTVLDIGTGTGAIGLSLKTERPTWQVTLSDISPKALAVAKENQARLNVTTTLVESDLLTNIVGTFDVIVSNPPYIATDEADLMDESVLKHEPKTALFAPDNGLYLYKQLAKQLTGHLRPHATLYLEIGFKQAKAVTEIFAQKFPHVTVQVKQDITGHDRMVKVSF